MAAKKPKMYARLDICFLSNDHEDPGDPYWRLYVRGTRSGDDTVRMESESCYDTVTQTRSAARRMAKLLEIEITDETSKWCLTCKRLK